MPNRWDFSHAIFATILRPPLPRNDMPNRWDFSHAIFATVLRRLHYLEMICQIGGIFRGIFATISRPPPIPPKNDMPNWGILHMLITGLTLGTIFSQVGGPEWDTIDSPIEGRNRIRLIRRCWGWGGSLVF